MDDETERELMRIKVRCARDAFRKVDPMDLGTADGSGHPPDEYDAEAAILAIAVPSATSSAAIALCAQHLLGRTFGARPDFARCAELADELVALWPPDFVEPEQWDPMVAIDDILAPWQEECDEMNDDPVIITRPDGERTKATFTPHFLLVAKQRFG